MTLILIIAFLTWLYWVLRITWYLIEVMLFWDAYYPLVMDWLHREEA